MEIILATNKDVTKVREIAASTVKEVYPKYYPQAAVDWFLKYYSTSNIRRDIDNECVYLAYEGDVIVGTVTVRGNEICRLFVKTDQQGKGYGSKMLDFGEGIVSKQYSMIRLDSSYPSEKMYLKRGYKPKEYNEQQMDDGTFLCYDIMMKKVTKK